jgi:hypothetical protein
MSPIRNYFQPENNSDWLRMFEKHSVLSNIFISDLEYLFGHVDISNSWEHFLTGKTLDFIVEVRDNNVCLAERLSLLMFVVVFFIVFRKIAELATR